MFGVQMKNPQSEVQSVGALLEECGDKKNLSTTQAPTRTGQTATEVATEATSRVGGAERHH
jgi:hypothetical protein